MRVNFNKPESVSTDKKTVHNIVILDSSGSMGGDKWKAAVEFVNNEMKEYVNQDIVNVLFSTIIFSSRNQIRTVQWRESSPIAIDADKNFMGNMTALNDAIYQTLDKKDIDDGCQVLVKIFTDGNENGSINNNRTVSELVKECILKGYTITFSGTQGDVETAKRLYGIDDSNTFVHTNTADSIADYGQQTRVITMSYFKSVAKGEDVTTGFYSKTINNED